MRNLSEIQAEIDELNGKYDGLQAEIRAAKTQIFLLTESLDVLEESGDVAATVETKNEIAQQQQVLAEAEALAERTLGQMSLTDSAFVNTWNDAKTLGRQISNLQNQIAGHDQNIEKIKQQFRQALDIAESGRNRDETRLAGLEGQLEDLAGGVDFSGRPAGNPRLAGRSQRVILL